MRFTTSKPPETLARTQRWMQSCILTKGDASEAVRSPGAAAEFSPAEAAGVIRPSWSLKPLERLDIYRTMYELRLRDALAVDYPGVLRFLGEDLFDELAGLYIRQHPSRSYTLNRFGERLPAFLPSVEGLPNPGFARDLARIELASTQVFDAEETAPADPACALAIPSERWERVRLVPIRAFRLLAVDCPVHDYLKALQSGREPRRPRRRATWLAVFRRSYAVRRLALPRLAFELLMWIVEGATLGEALQRVAATGGLRERDVRSWFEIWLSEGIFQNIHVE